MATVNEIFAYTEQEWHDKQAEIREHIVEGRKSLGLTQEWVASNAGYSITQYIKLEDGSRFLEFVDFLRIGAVFYKYQESLLPAYLQTWHRFTLFIRTTCFNFRFYLKDIRDKWEE